MGEAMARQFNSTTAAFGPVERHYLSYPLRQLSGPLLTGCDGAKERAGRESERERPSHSARGPNLPTMYEAKPETNYDTTGNGAAQRLALLPSNRISG